MSIIRLFFTRDLALLTMTLGVASIAATAMVAVRILYTGQLLYAFLVWNLILAWIPFVLAVVIQARVHQVGWCDWQCFALASGWLLFLPNAPYIFTDLVHLSHSAPKLFWPDLTLVLITAFIGLALGLASLRLLHGLVARWRGWLTGWLFVATVASLAAFGVHLGRFVRLNSWDMALAPLTLAREVAGTVVGMVVHPHQAVFPALFAFFLFLSYTLLHALSGMQHGRQLKPNLSTEIRRP